MRGISCCASFRGRDLDLHETDDGRRDADEVGVTAVRSTSEL